MHLVEQANAYYVSCNNNKTLTILVIKRARFNLLLKAVPLANLLQHYAFWQRANPLNGFVVCYVFIGNTGISNGKTILLLTDYVITVFSNPRRPTNNEIVNSGTA